MRDWILFHEPEQLSSAAGITPSGSFPRADGPLNGGRQLVLDAFAPLGITGEGLNLRLRIVALDIDHNADVAAVSRLRIDEAVTGRWYFEEASVRPERQTL
ncbi:MAG: hypothetical protein JST33_13975 [Actinobacteria bacterium]|nr:hypothetical protein [Actinomycetota bacterium]